MKTRSPKDEPLNSGKQKNDLTVELKNQLARAMADYDNLRKRVEKEREEIFKFSLISFINRLLPIVDMLEAAQKHLNDAGLGISLNELKNLLKEEGIVTIVSASGEVFNEKYHEAVDIVAGGEKNTIAESLLCGYKYNDEMILRYEKVRVYKGE